MKGQHEGDALCVIRYEPNGHLVPKRARLPQALVVYTAGQLLEVGYPASAAGPARRKQPMQPAFIGPAAAASSDGDRA